MNEEIIKILGEIVQIAIKANDSKDEGGLIFFISYSGHVNQMSFGVAKGHYSVKIYEKELYICGGLASESVILKLGEVKDIFEKLATGQFRIKTELLLENTF